jgi:hypothetical protein
MPTSPTNGAGSSPVSLNLPVVSEGDPIRAADINNLSAAIEKISMGMGDGYVVQTYGRKSQLTIDDPTTAYRTPWGCMSSGQKLRINIGNVFMNGNDKEFRPLTTYGFAGTTNALGRVFAGNKITFELPGQDAADSLSIPATANGVLTCNFQPGYYYIEVVYSIISNIVENIIKLTIKGDAFLRYSRTEDGIGEYVNPITGKKNDNTYPICTVTENAMIIQGVRSDIFARGADLTIPMPDIPDVDFPDIALPEVFDHPFKIKLEALTNGSYAIVVVPGTVCNVLPKYENGNQLWNDSPWVYTPTSSARPMFIYLSCKPATELEANGGRFPSEVTVKMTYQYDPESFDKDDEGCLLLGVCVAKYIQVPVTDPKGITTYVGKWVASGKQFVSTSVWAERRKYSNQIANYYFYRV